MILRTAVLLEPGTQIQLDAGPPWTVMGIRPSGDRIAVDLYNDDDQKMGLRIFPGDLVEIVF
jgi:hypothetical protein